MRVAPTGVSAARSNARTGGAGAARRVAACALIATWRTASAVQDETLLGTMMDRGPPIAANCSSHQLALGVATVTRLALVLVFASALGALPAGPVLPDDHDGRDREHERGYQHGRRDEHHRYRVYGPPAVYDPRGASTGITLFIPSEIR